MREGSVGLGLVALALAPVLVSLACTPDLGKLGDVADESTSTDGDSTDDGELPPPEERMAVLRLDDGALDVLFVIDNSGSMGIEQSRVATAITSFAAELVDTHGADLRVGFTTTDDGNPWCQGTSPEAGQLVLSSCRSRLTSFVFQGLEVIDVTEEACLSLCGEDEIATIPTATHLDDVPASRPWLESQPGGSNVEGISLEQAIMCTAPQGINGCGFESPLEAMHKTLDRTESPSDASHGFLRPWARLAVVFVTDEADCSVDDAWQEIFLPESDRVFWSDPTEAAPTSAVCWNAGVECQGSGPEIGPCNPQNYDVDGNVTDAANAVMRSLTRYIEDLQAVEAGKAAYRPQGAVAVQLLGGVPQGYADGEAELRYTRTGADPEFIRDFGVDPGCQGPEGEAVPPVRLRALAELFPAAGETMIHSICRDTYVPVFEQLAQRLASRQDQRVGCVPACLADTDPATAGTQPQCEVIMSRGVDGQRVETLLAACDGSGGVPPGQEACVSLRTDALAAACTGQGSNAELEVVIADGVELRGEISIEAVCEQADAGAC